MIQKIFSIINSNVGSVSAFIALAALLYSVHVHHRDTVYAQASKVAAWQKSIYGNGGYLLHNGSAEPIYNVVYFLQSNNQFLTGSDAKKKLKKMNENGDLEFIETVPPGDLQTDLDAGGFASGGEHSVPAIFFTDSNNCEWYRMANGKLRKSSYTIHAAKAGIMLKHIVTKSPLQLRLQRKRMQLRSPICRKHSDTRHGKKS